MVINYCWNPISNNASSTFNVMVTWFIWIQVFPLHRNDLLNGLNEWYLIFVRSATHETSLALQCFGPRSTAGWFRFLERTHIDRRKGNKLEQSTSVTKYRQTRVQRGTVKGGQSSLPTKSDDKVKEKFVECRVSTWNKRNEKNVQTIYTRLLHNTNNRFPQGCAKVI